MVVPSFFFKVSFWVFEGRLSRDGVGLLVSEYMCNIGEKT